jgi:hypothetical protein
MRWPGRAGSIGGGVTGQGHREEEGATVAPFCGKGEGHGDHHMAGGGGLQGRWRGCTLASGGTWHLHDKQGEKVKAGGGEEFLEENEGEQVSSATYVEEEWVVRELLAVGENEDGGGNLAFIDDEGRGGA